MTFQYVDSAGTLGGVCSVRSVPEWIGATDDTPVPPRVKLRVFERHGGRCYLSGRLIRPGDAWDVEHVRALCNGGENRESNLKPALKDPHKVKTRRDRKEKARMDARRKGFLGIEQPKRRMGYRLFDGTPVDPNRR